MAQNLYPCVLIIVIDVAAVDRRASQGHPVVILSSQSALYIDKDGYFHCTQRVGIGEMFFVVNQVAEFFHCMSCKDVT